MSAGTDLRIPVTLLCGFLGSGKTTLLNQMLRQPEMADTLVVVNEFGAVPLDHLLVIHNNDDMVLELGNGCLCCSIRGDLLTTLRDALWRFSRGGGQRSFRRVLIEASGLATPAPIIHTLLSHASLAAHYRIASVLAVVDMVCGAQTIAAHAEAVKQAAVADVLLLSKPDLATPAQQSQLQTRLDGINPSAPRHRVLNGVVDAEHLLEGWMVRQDAPLAATNWLREQDYSRYQPQHAPHEVADAALLNRHGERIRAFCFVAAEPVPREAFEEWMRFLFGLMGERMLRIKGIVYIQEEKRPLLIHGVQHLFYPPQRLTGWPGEDHRSRIVFITDGIERTVIEKSFSAFKTHFEETYA